MQFTIVPPENTSFGGPLPYAGTGAATQLAVSPDGRNIVFVAGARPAYQLWLRPVAALAARPIPGTEGATFPFWSPDSRFIGFFSGRKLKRVPIDGGEPTVLCDANDGRGGTWSRDNLILFTPTGGGVGVQRVSSAGGVPTVVTTPDRSTGETTHRWPHFLPDGRHFLYTAIAGQAAPGSKPSVVKIGSLDPAEPAVTLFPAESSVIYASGHVLFAREDTLMAQLFDPNVRQPRGEAFPLAEHASTEGSRYVGASVSENGTLVYARDDSLMATQLTWLDRAGRALGTVSESAPYIDLALSPDERHVAVALETGSPENFDIWIIDIARNSRSRLTVDPGRDVSPVWSPDGTRIAFEGLRSGKVSLRQQLINGTAGDEPLLEVSGTPARPCDISKGILCGLTPSGWSADGRHITYSLRGSFPRTSDVLVLPLSGDRKPFPVAETAFFEESGPFSPDGRWIAYTTNEDGEPNVYVQPFPPTGAKYRVSRDGGSQPLWRPDTKEVFYLGADGTLMAVPVNTADQFAVGVPQGLFQTGSIARAFLNRTYAVSKDGKRFLVSARTQQSSAPLTVVLDWTATIRK